MKIIGGLAIKEIILIQIELPSITEDRFHFLVQEMHLQEASVLLEAFQKMMAHLEDMYANKKYK